MSLTVIFDFDGTIADCKQLHQSAFRSAVKQVCPIAQYDDETVEGRPTREKIRILHSMGYEFDGDELNRIKQQLTQRELEIYIKPAPELEHAIKYLKFGRGFHVCLATNATHEFIHRSLEIMGIKHLFDRINTATDFPAKPDTTIFDDCIKHTGSQVHNTYIFEDSPVGIQCARATGANVIEVSDVEDTIRKIYKL